MRGNLNTAVKMDDEYGSIPAHAGEPGARCPTGCGTWVYPRACGGTFVISGDVDPDNGLSPRMRGNRIVLDGDETRQGSIPAHAGEPGSRPS